MLVTHTNFRSGTGGTGDEAPQLRDHNFPCEFDLNYHELTAEEKHQQKKAFKAVASQLGLSNFGFDSESKDPAPLPAVSSSDNEDPKDNELEGQDASASGTADNPLVLDTTNDDNGQGASAAATDPDITSSSTDSIPVNEGKRFKFSCTH